MRSKLRSFLAGGSIATLVLVGSSGFGCAKVDTVLETDGGKQAGPDSGANPQNEGSLVPNDKVDLLFVVDNSSRMAEKQAILAKSAATLINGLVAPPCLSPNGLPSGAHADAKASKENRYGCPEGTAPAFKPVNDMHVGAITTSLGSFGGDMCGDLGGTNNGARLQRTTSAPDRQTLARLGFFPWALPNAPAETLNDLEREGASAITDGAALVEDVQKLIEGVGTMGCQFGAQLESLYHFLVAPDPWGFVGVGNGTVRFDGFDFNSFADRNRFLRPDSFLAIVMLTDKDDSSPDPLSFGGQGWAFSSSVFPGSTVARTETGGSTAPRATSVCQKDASSPDCMSCGYAKTCKAGDPACERVKADPACADANGGYYGPLDDDMDVRYHHMKERFGVDPQYPLSRYVDALTKPFVPSLLDEHPIAADGTIQDYVGTPSCRNPVFAARATDVTSRGCDRPAGPRRPEQVALLVIGGVPNQLLYTDLSSPTSSRITPTAWTPILGANPDAYDYAGIDPHMIQSVEPRAGLPGPTSPDDSDPIHGREYDTQKHQLQFACTFALHPTSGCDGTMQNSPLCPDGPTKAIAYPTPREFRVAKGLGESGIIGSICPIQIDDPSAANYGYTPSFDALLRRIVPFLEQ